MKLPTEADDRCVSRFLGFNVLVSLAVALALAEPLAAQEPRMLPGHTGPVKSVVFSPDGNLLASCSSGPPARVMLWNATNGQLVSDLSRSGGQRVHQLAFGPDGKTLVGCAKSYGSCNCDENVLVWDTATFGVRRSESFPSRRFYTYAISRDGSTLAMATRPDWSEARWARMSELAKESGPFASRPSDQNLTLWDVTAGRMRAGAEIPDVFALALSPDGKILAASQRNRVVLLDAPSLQPLDMIDVAGQAAVMTFSHDGTMLATVPQSSDDPKSPGKSVSLWNLSTGDLTKTFHAQTGPIRALAFSSRDRILATAGGSPTYSELKLWDLVSGTLLCELNGHDGPVQCVAFSPDGRTLASAGDDRLVRLWDLTDRLSSKVAVTGPKNDPEVTDSADMR